MTPPELVALTEGPRRLPPGRALELGYGTGTNALYFARHGWDVTAVDLIDRAVERARQKAAETGAAYGCCTETAPASTNWTRRARSTCSST
ncbi:class I SAM-dependent methyltransferase [Nonomuraea fuscirosea]|uniref:class I SAM-dependent methyltransferase n=1 Tax=Nonomuraea fuscirosea TaxID=1291556 RepID=UPI003448D15B